MMRTRKTAWTGAGLLAGVVGGTLIGVAVSAGSADEPGPTVQTTETTTVQLTETLPPVVVPAPAPVVSTEPPAPVAPTVEAVTETPAPEPVASPVPTQRAAETRPTVPSDRGPIVMPLVTTDANGPLPPVFVPIPPTYGPGVSPNSE